MRVVNRTSATASRARSVLRGGRIVAPLAVLALAVLVLVWARGADAANGRAARFDTGVVNVDTNLGLENASAAGTGIVLSASGEVLTNNHVIRGATTVRVTDPSTSRTYPATVVGYDVAHDIAVLQLKGASHLQPAKLGKSSTVRVGDTVTAVGNAGGVGGTPSSTSGTVTALNRSITVSDDQGSSERLTGLIETNAALQPGDSGGPLLDAAGRVIGVDTAASTGFAFQQGAGDGFAVAIDTALEIARQIVSGHASATIHLGPTPFLGLEARSAGPFLGSSTAGALVVGTFPGSPAESAGLASGDVITGLDDSTVTSPTTLTSLLLRKSPGAAVKLSWVDPYGNPVSASVRLAAGPPQ